jgi:hypothetical protein
MPTLTPLAWALWIAIAIAQLALAVVVCLTDARKRWSALATFLIVRCVTTAALMAVTLCPGDDGWYSGLYSLSSCASAGIRVWMIAELGCALTVAVQNWKNLIRGGCMAFAGALTLVGAVALEWPRPAMVAVSWWIITNGTRDLCFAWVCVFALIVFVGAQFGLQWDGRDAGIALGLAIQAASACVLLWLYQLSPSSALLSNAQDSAYLVSLGVWAVAVLRREEQETLGIEQLRKISEPYIELGKGLREQ